MAPFSLVEIYWHFGVTYCFLLQGSRGFYPEEMLLVRMYFISDMTLKEPSPLKTEAVPHSESPLDLPHYMSSHPGRLILKSIFEKH